MAQVWKCTKCGYVTWEPKDAGNHERRYNKGKLYEQVMPKRGPIHFMEDLGE